MVVKFKDQETLIKEGYYNEHPNNYDGDWWESLKKYKDWLQTAYKANGEKSLYLVIEHVGQIINSNESVYYQEHIKDLDWAIEKYYDENEYPESYI